MRDTAGVALVVSGDLAGVKAAIDLADNGFAVYLLDESINIEGVMVALDKILRTSDCLSCVLPPKLVDKIEDDKNDHVVGKDFCIGCETSESFVSAKPLNERTGKPDGV